MKLFFSAVLLTYSLGLLAQKQTPVAYIEKYKDLAIVEMHRSGVPASITLAQGVLESNSGNSRLAKYANNHFGIKCKGDWSGNVIYANDDAPDECFRAYSSVLASYQDHSDFLRKNWRYHPLFELDRTDYKGWCNGLRKAGYATNRQYGSILISLIERYELDQYDTKGMPGTGLPNMYPGEAVNGVPVKTVKEGETVASIAKDNYLKDRHIRKWNDLSASEEVKEGDVVFLKPKRRRGSAASHIVIEGESMHDISQKYGIKLKQLYKKNRMNYGSEPKEGEKLNMQKKRKTDDVVDVKTKKPQWEEQKEEVFINPHSVPKKVIENTDFSNPGALNKQVIRVPEYHVVAKGDNIYRIAERYHIIEEDILAMNKSLNPNAMYVGQKVYLKKGGKRTTPTKPKGVPAPKVKAPTTYKEVEKVRKDIVVDGPVSHIVVKGDTLYNICKRYGVTVDQLKEWNGLNTITINLGQKLQVSE